MNITPTPIKFETMVLESSQKELSGVGALLIEHRKILKGHQESIFKEDPCLQKEKNKKIFGVFSSSLLEVRKMRDFIRAKDSYSEYKMVVAYQTSDKRPQALALIASRGNCLELYSQITSVWNLNCPQNDSENRVRGAGSAIVEFVKQLGIQQKAEFISLLSASEALSFYEKHGFKQEPAQSKTEDMFFLERTPMNFDLKELQNTEK